MSDKIKNISIHFEQIAQNILADPRFMRVKVWICNIGENYNGSYFSKEVLTQMASTLNGIPIVGYIGKNKYKEIDFRSHEEQLTIKDGEYQFEYLGFAYGFIPSDNNAKFESKIGSDGVERTYLTTEGLIWTKWKDVIDIFERDNYEKSHSMELLDGHTEGYFDKNDNLYHFTECMFDSLCVLGSDIMPGVESSCIHKFSYVDIKNQIINMINEYNNFSKKESIVSEPISDVKLNADEVLIEHIDSNLNNNFESIKNEKEDENIMTEGEGIGATNKDINTDFSLTSKQIIDIIEVETCKIKYKNGDYEYERYWVKDFDDSYVYVRDYVEDICKRIPYKIDNMVASVDFESAEVVIDGGYKVVGEVVNNENSGDIFENSTPDYQKMYEDMKIDYEKMQVEFEAIKTEYASMKTEYEANKTDMAGMKTKMEATESEFASLKEYKLNKENKEKENLFSQFASNLTEDEMKSIKEISDNSTIEEIESRLFALIGKKNFSLNSNNNSIISMGLDINPSIETENKSGKPYDDILRKYAKQE